MEHLLAAPTEDWTVAVVPGADHFLLAIDGTQRTMAGFAAGALDRVVRWLIARAADL